MPGPEGRRLTEIGEPMKPCPECNSEKVYRCSERISAGGASLLPGLSGRFSQPEYVVVVCGECGYVRNYASREARKNLDTSEYWKKA